MKQKQLLISESKELTPSKAASAKMSKEALNYISELEIELDRTKTELAE